MKSGSFLIGVADEIENLKGDGAGITHTRRLYGIIPFFAEQTAVPRASFRCSRGIARAQNSPSAVFPALPQAGQDSGSRPPDTNLILKSNQ